MTDFVTLDVAATESLRQRIETEQTVSHWGRDHTITPCLISHVFGDGQMLLRLWPMMLRPFYFVVQLDSETDIKSIYFHDFLDEIKEAIENQCPEICFPDATEDDSGDSILSDGVVWEVYKNA